MNPLAFTILAGIGNEEDRLQKLTTVPRFQLPDAEKFALADLDANRGVRISFSDWTGEPPTASNRQRHHRELARLECAGLIVLTAKWGHRTSHAKLTKAGREVLR